MTAPQPDLPRDPAAYRPRRAVGLIGAAAFGILCVLAGAGAAVYAPRWLPARGEPAQPAAPAVAAQPAPVAIAAPPAAPAIDEVAALKARIATLESQGARSTEAAAAALAVAQLVDATRSSRPFARELAALRAAAPGLPELAALGRLAETGAPSRTALAASFDEYATLAVRKARKPPEGSDVGQRLAYTFSKAVTVRRVDDLSGATPDAMIARAERALGEGEVIAALKALDGLPPPAQAALAPWRAGAERRAEIDREVAALRLRAIRDLQPAEAAPQGPAA
ncbi:MAG: hypothetical protein AB1942_21565 [Pseudomonadota bacterium]